SPASFLSSRFSVFFSLRLSGRSDEELEEKEE
ncbi:unnamed protein product, partial [marine sediment metagenome]